MLSRPSSNSSRAGLLAVLLLGAAQFAAAQSHEASSGDLTLRSSTVSSERIDPATAARHGIVPSPTTSVLNVVVLRGIAQQTIPARVNATARSLAGVRQDIAMREVRENGRVSYLGTYEVLPREVLDLEVRATPLAPRASGSLVLRYRERAWGIEGNDGPR